LDSTGKIKYTKSGKEIRLGLSQDAMTN